MHAFFFGQTLGLSYTEFIHINKKAKPLTEELTMAKAKKAAKKTATKKTATKKTATKKAAPKKAAAAPKAPKAAKKTATKRKPNPAFMRPLTPSANLAAVVGAAPLPRTEVVKKLWQYIKKNGLQDSKNRRNINADDKLKPIFGKAQVSMFEMTKLVSKHLK
jgi:upstream activation factor subunit UAF30